MLYISMHHTAQEETVSLKGAVGATRTFVLFGVPCRNAFWINHPSMLSSFMWEIFPTVYNFCPLSIHVSENSFLMALAGPSFLKLCLLSS